MTIMISRVCVGHLFPIDYGMQQRFGDTSKYVFERKSKFKGRPSPVNSQCAALATDGTGSDRWNAYIAGRPIADDKLVAPAAEVAAAPAPVVPQDGSVLKYGDFAVHVGEGSFHVKHTTSGGILDIRNLGTSFIEMVDSYKDIVKAVVLHPTRGVITYTITIPAVPSPHSDERVALACSGESFDAVGAFFGPTPDDAWNIKNGAPTACQPDGSVCRDGWTEWMGAQMVEAEPANLCSAPINGDAIKGMIVMITRGKCTFLDKVLHAQAAGAVGVIMGNVIDANNIFMMVHIATQTCTIMHSH